MHYLIKTLEPQYHKSPDEIEDELLLINRAKQHPKDFAVLYEKYYKKYLSVQIIINQLSGCIVYLVFMINYEILRHTLCLIFNRPLEIIPDLFRQPYRAISSVDFWSRWHQM